MSDFERDPRPNPREVVTTKALSVWLGAIAVYLGAILGRTSFGVAGLQAMDRFDVDASRIAVFASVQLLTYASAQVPMGVAIDRFGPRKMLVVGAIVMGIGQLILGLTGSYAVAIGARVLIGAGDATAFLSVMRLLPYWFPLHRTPMFTAFTVSIGQLGQFLSAVPFLWLLGAQGWTVAFVSLGAVVILIALGAAVAVADTPEKAGVYHDYQAVEETRLSIKDSIRRAASSRVTWQAFFIHYAGMHASVVFLLMWGVPLMTEGMNLSSGQAGAILTINAVGLMFAGPLHGKISARAGRNRDMAVLAFSLFGIVSWFWMLSSPTPRGFGAAVYIALVFSLIQLSSNYGFDQIRETLDRQIVATATGIGNMGGFLAGMVGAQVFGILLDRHAQGSDFVWADFRYAAWAVFVLWVIALIGILATRGGTTRRVKIQTVS